MRGAHLGPYCYPIAIDLLARGLVTSDGIVTHGYALEQWDEAIGVANSLDSIKVLLKPAAYERDAIRATSSASTSARRAPRRCCATRAGASSRSTRGLPARYAAAAVGRAVAAGVARRGARVHRRLRGAAAASEPGFAPAPSAPVHQQPLRRLGHSGRRDMQPAASVPDLDGPARAGARSTGCARNVDLERLADDHRQRRRQLLRLHQDAVAAQPAARRLPQHARVPAAQRFVSRADRRGRGGSLVGRQHRRRLRHRARHWSDEMLDALGIPATLMPARLVASSDVVGGRCTRCRRAQLGLRRARPSSPAASMRRSRRWPRASRRAGQHVAMIGIEHVLGLRHARRRRAPRPGQHAARVRRRARRLRVRRRDHRRRGGDVVPRQLLPGRDRRGAGRRGRRRTTCSKPARATSPRAREGVLFLPYLMGERSPMWDAQGERRVRRPQPLPRPRRTCTARCSKASAFALRHNIEAGVRGAASARRAR